MNLAQLRQLVEDTKDLPADTPVLQGVREHNYGTVNACVDNVLKEKVGNGRYQFTEWYGHVTHGYKSMQELEDDGHKVVTAIVIS